MESKKDNLFKRYKNCLKDTYNEVVEKIERATPVWKGAILSLIIVYLILGGITGYHIDIGFGTFWDILILFVGSALILLGSVFVLSLIIPIVKDLPNLFLAVLISIFIILVIAISECSGLNDQEALIASAILIVLEGVFGASLWVIIKGKKKIGASILLGITITINAYGVYWLFSKGVEEYNLNLPKSYSEVQSFNGKSPAEIGKYKVKELTYGSGKDKRRKEYGEDADIISKSVNARSFVGTISGFKGKERRWFWGFDERNFPLNGTVWYPDGEGKFPLVLMVHGNHAMEEPSDEGYEYLGKLLASRGYIAVSVDENFLNGSWSGGLGGENDGRAWMLLEHLKLWHQWNNDLDSIFRGKVDTDNIALIGHSRGGEAVSIAATFNKLNYYPNDGDVKLDYNFNIKSVIAIAPTDAQYKPGGKFTPLENVNYMVLQGSNDSDVSSFYGSRQYNRVAFTDDDYHFKTSLYIGGANHGQFNTVWGDEDLDFPDELLLNKRALISQENQRKIGEVYISAFLDTTLKNQVQYMPMFKNYEYALNWLPKTVYMNRFQDSNFVNVANFDEDIDLKTTTIKNGEISANGIYHWREYEIKLRGNTDSYNSGVYLTWKYASVTDKSSEGTRWYYIKLPEDFNNNVPIDKGGGLAFSIADTGNETYENGEPITDKVDLTVQLLDKEGNTSEIPLSKIGTLSTAIKSDFSKIEWIENNYSEDIEPNLQSFIIPISEFTKENKELNYKDIEAIKFIFNKQVNGEVIIDDVGFEVK